ncbi:L,D-transpeptidase [candidate division WOR-3 bacterium]|nr:L,D-transpeptidase [candidate division WOR-3 bacterium]
MSARIKVLLTGALFVLLELFLLAVVSCNYSAKLSVKNPDIRIPIAETELSFKQILFFGGDIIESEFIYPHPQCTVPSYAVFYVKPSLAKDILDISAIHTSGGTEVVIHAGGDSFFYSFDHNGGKFEIPFTGVDYSPMKIIVRRGGREETFALTLYSERWLEVFCDWDIQCAVLWEGARPRYWTVVSTGKENWTRAEHCRIFSKSPVAYFVLDRAPMRYWLGFQEVYGTVNGTHAPLSGTWWRLGRQGSHGCVRNPLADKFYALLDTGNRVELHYRYSQGFTLKEINPAWEYLILEPLDTLEDTMPYKQYCDEARKRLLPIYEELIKSEKQE